MYWKELNVFFFTFGSVSHYMSAPHSKESSSDAL